MTLLLNGKDTLINNGVTNITNIGFWILVNEIEYFVPFNEYPCFRKATVSQIEDFKVLSPNQIYWETLDCDIELEALKNPQNYPLKFVK